MYNTQLRVLVGGQVCNMIRSADDKAVVSGTQKGLPQLTDDLNRVTKDYGMKIDVKKTKVKCISRKGNCRMKILIGGQLVEQMSEFRYLGSLRSEDGYCESEIHNRKAMGKKIFMELKKQIIKYLSCMLQRHGH